MSNLPQKQTQAISHFKSDQEEAVKLHEGYKKMRDFVPNDWEKITKDIIGLASSLGIKEYSSQEIEYIIDFLKQEARDFSFSELKKGVNMAVAGKLTNSKGEEIKPYGSLLNFIGSVMGAYRKHRARHLASIKKEPTAEEKEALEKKKKENFNQDMEDSFKILRRREKQNNFEFTYSQGIAFYDCLKHFGMMPEYRSDKLWKQALYMVRDDMKGSKDEDSKAILLSFINPEKGLSPKQYSRKLNATIGHYKRLLLIKFLEEDLKFFESLEQAREELEK